MPSHDAMRAPEIEISRADDPAARQTYSQVRPRHTPGVTRYAAVYPDLAAGPYTIWHDEQSPAATTVIAGGRVTTSHWPEPGR